MAYAQVIDNIIFFEVPGITYIDSAISKKDKMTPWQVILGLKGLSEEIKNENIFISVEKDQCGNFILFYEKNFHRYISTIAKFLPAIM